MDLRLPEAWLLDLDTSDVSKSNGPLAKDASPLCAKPAVDMATTADHSAVQKERKVKFICT